MIIEDSGEKEKDHKTRIGAVFNQRNIPYKREWIVLKNEDGEDERCGDYTDEEKTFLVERKSTMDYLGSLLSGHLWEQLARMAELFPGPKYLLLEGDWDGLLDYALKSFSNTGIYCNLIASRQKLVKFNIGLIQTIDEFDSARELQYLSFYAKNVEDFKIGVEKKWVRRVKDERVRLLMRLPGIGDNEKKAQFILGIYGTVLNFINVIHTDIKEVIKTLKGHRIGKITLQKLDKLFTSDDWNGKDSGGTGTKDNGVHGGREQPAGNKSVHRGRKNYYRPHDSR